MGNLKKIFWPVSKTGQIILCVALGLDTFLALGVGASSTGITAIMLFLYNVGKFYFAICVVRIFLVYLKVI